MCLNTYPFGKIWLKTLSEYQSETAGNPNSPIPVNKNSVSKEANKTKRFTNEVVRLIPSRFFVKKKMLYMFIKIPITDAGLKLDMR